MLTPRQQQCLEGMGICVWRERGAPTAVESADPAESTPGVDAGTDFPPVRTENRALTRPVRSGPTGTNADSADRARHQPDIAVETSSDPGSHEDSQARSVPDGAVRSNSVPAAEFDSWDGLIEAIHACEACELSRNCTQKVPGVGSREADLMIIGEGPGHDEDIRGEPFVGRSGQLLDRMLAAIGIAREQVYITNIVKCRPPNNRDPKPEEALKCRAFLEAQIRHIEPRVILSVGRVSAHNLLGTNAPVGKLIRQLHTLPGTEIPVKVTYHPAYLLRNPSAKATAWQDLKQLYRMLK